MRKKLSVLLLSAMLSMGASAQGSVSPWSVNTRAWCTNYFTTAIVGIAEAGVMKLAEGSKDTLLIDRIIPTPSLVFPVGFSKKGFDYPRDIYTPYHRAFSNPLKYLGDYAIGVDVLYAPSVIGVYAGAYFKSQEITFANDPLDLDGKNLRAFYFQPRIGLSLNFGDSHRSGIEAGVFYDVLTGCGGSFDNVEKDMFEGGFGLDFALRFGNNKRYQQNVLQLSLPLHNFVNEDYKDGSLKGVKRRVGYIMLTERITL
jgi:hypothetical protein